MSDSAGTADNGFRQSDPEALLRTRGQMKILGRYVFREILAGSFSRSSSRLSLFSCNELDRFLNYWCVPNAPGWQLELIGLRLLPVLLLSIPFGVLVGILIGLGRMSGDNEMVAMRSTGISTRLVVTPVLFFAFLATLVSGACAIWLNPIAIHHEYYLLNKVAGEQLTANVEPRIFQEQFSNDNTVLYVEDVVSGLGPALWRGIFIADTTPPSQRKSVHGGMPTGPIITLAREAIAIPDQAHNRIQLSMREETRHESSIDAQKGETGYHSFGSSGDTALNQTPPAEQKAKPTSEMTTRELLRNLGIFRKGSQDWIDNDLELHRRLALPVACMMLAMVGIPLGTSSRLADVLRIRLGDLPLLLLLLHGLHLADECGAARAFAESGTRIVASECGVRHCGSHSDRAHGIAGRSRPARPRAHGRIGVDGFDFRQAA